MTVTIETMAATGSIQPAVGATKRIRYLNAGGFDVSVYHSSTSYVAHLICRGGGYDVSVDSGGLMPKAVVFFTNANYLYFVRTSGTAVVAYEDADPDVFPGAAVQTNGGGSSGTDTDIVPAAGVTMLATSLAGREDYYHQAALKYNDSRLAAFAAAGAVRCIALPFTNTYYATLENYGGQSVEALSYYELPPAIADHLALDATWGTTYQPAAGVTYQLIAANKYLTNGSVNVSLPYDRALDAGATRDNMADLRQASAPITNTWYLSGGDYYVVLEKEVL